MVIESKKITSRDTVNVDRITLGDGSKVYDVRLIVRDCDDSLHTTRFCAADYSAAMRLFEALTGEDIVSVETY